MASCIVRACASLAILLALVGCQALPDRPPLPAEHAVPAGNGGPLDAAIAPTELRHAGQSAFRLSVDGPEAFAIRARSARLAVRSLDVQMYIWRPDLTGLVLAHEIVSAADRGVRVRLLLDDLDARSKGAALGYLKSLEPFNKGNYVVDASQATTALRRSPAVHLHSH